MHVSKVNVGRPHGIETSQRRTKLGEGSSSQSECDVRFRSEADIEVLSPDVRLPRKQTSRNTMLLKVTPIVSAVDYWTAKSLELRDKVMRKDIQEALESAIAEFEKRQQA